MSLNIASNTDNLQKIPNNLKEIPNNLKIITPIENKAKTIKGINISNKELSEKIGDLFYDSLSSFISLLGDKIDNKEVSELLKKASNDIMNAWNICLPYISYDFPTMKHSTEIKGLNIDKEELSKRISNLENLELSDFLEKFSLKIRKDGESDKERKRIKLANELFSGADKLQKSSDILKGKKLKNT